MDCAMEQSLKKTMVHMYGVYNTPVAFALHPRRSVSLHAALRMERASYCVCTHMWDRN